MMTPTSNSSFNSSSSSSSSSPPLPSDLFSSLDSELKYIGQSLKPASASRIATITKLALKYVKYYKFIVHHIIQFIKTCAPELKLSGLYMVDSICRASIMELKKRGKSYFEKEPYVSRFESALMSITSDIQKSPESDGDKMKKLLTVWRQYSVFPDSFLYKAETSWISSNSSSSSFSTSVEESSTPSQPSTVTSFTSFSSNPPYNDPSSIVTPWSFSTNSNPSPSFSFLPPPLIPPASNPNTTVSAPSLHSTSSSSVLPISFAGLQIPLPSLPLPTPASTIPLPLPPPAPLPVLFSSTSTNLPPPPPSFLSSTPSTSTHFSLHDPPPPSLLPFPPSLPLPPLPFPLPPPPSPSFDTSNARKRTFEDMQPTTSLEDINWYTTPVFKESGEWVQIEGGCGPDEIKGKIYETDGRLL